MSWAKPADGEPWISKEEIIAREVEQMQREYDELKRLIEERCRKAEARWRATHLWLQPGWCVSVPIRNSLCR